MKFILFVEGHTEEKAISSGKSLFDKLNPDTVYQKCPYCKFMLDEMLKFAMESGM